VALTESLAKRHIAGAGLDVYADEPVINEKLRSLSNVVLLPHIGSATIEGRLQMGDKVIINVQTFWDGHTPPDRVIEAML
jgi:glyoxylate reductase